MLFTSTSTKKGVVLLLVALVPKPLKAPLIVLVQRSTTMLLVLVLTAAVTMMLTLVNMMP